MDAGWATLLAFIGDSIVNSSKEVSLAAIASLNPLLISHAAKVILFFTGCIFYFLPCIFYLLLLSLSLSTATCEKLEVSYFLAMILFHTTSRKKPQENCRIYEVAPVMIMTGCQIFTKQLDSPTVAAMCIRFVHT